MPSNGSIHELRAAAARAGRAGAIAAIVLSLSACMMHSAPPEDLDVSRSKTTEGGLYRGTLMPNDSVRVNRLHTWTVRLETPDGDPVEAAEVRVDGGMPQHGHGLPTRPRVTRYLGAGDYLVEGIKFNMPGWWVLKVYVQAPAGADSATYNLVL